jgi:hypothetical protein
VSLCQQGMDTLPTSWTPTSRAQTLYSPGGDEQCTQVVALHCIRSGRQRPHKKMSVDELISAAESEGKYDLAERLAERPNLLAPHCTGQARMLDGVELEHTGTCRWNAWSCTGTAIAISPGAGPQRGWTWEDGVHETISNGGARTHKSR